MSIGDPTSFSSLIGLSNIPEVWNHINAEEMRERMMRDITQAAHVNPIAAQQANAVHMPMPIARPTVRDNPFKPNLADRAREMFLKRMGGIRTELKIADGDFLQCHIYGEVVHLFYCFQGRAGVTQEGIDLFPSDQLITQFRMVLAT